MSDIFTLDENNNAAVRTVGVKAGAVESNQPDIFTTDENGNAAVRVVGGGGDSHNLGYFDTLQDLQTAYPTGEAGDWAIVAESDTVYIWDETQQAWVDTDRKGQVTSVNNQTGDVTVQETLVSGTNIKTINGNSILGSGNLELSTYLTYPNTWTTTGTTKAFCDDIAADASAVAGKAYLGEVTLSDLPASMANAEIVVEIMSGTTAANKVIVLTCTSGNTAPYRWQYTYWNNGTDVSGWKGFQEELTSGTNIKTVNGNSLLGSGDLTIGTTPATAPTLVVADWSGNAQTITVLGVTSSNVVFVSPAPASVSDYTNAGIICTAQGTDSLSFSCVTTPTNDITLNVVIF